MLKTIALVIVVAIAGILIFAATKPDTFRVERSIAIKAPPEKIFPLINDFKRWDAWSPWEKKDPAMKRTYGSATSGKGAHYAWQGNSDVGQGSMDIVESVPSSKVALKLDFVKPFEVTTLSTLRSRRKAKRPALPGLCRDLRRSSPKSSRCFAIWTA